MKERARDGQGARDRDMFVLEQAGHNICGRKSEIAQMCARTVTGGQEYEPRERNCGT